ncbi:hypothetical protein BDW75DRAFT_217905 [Aspergillus navahoensis]
MHSCNLKPTTIQMIVASHIEIIPEVGSPQKALIVCGILQAILCAIGLLCRQWGHTANRGKGPATSADVHLLFLVFRRKVQGQERVQFGFTVRSRVHLDQSNAASIAGRLDQTCRRGVQGVQVDQVQLPRHENWDQTWDMRLASRIGSQRKPAMQPR